MAKQTKNTLQDMRSKDAVALQKDVVEATKKLSTLRAELAVGKLTNHQAIAKVRKEIARMKTLLNEKNILKEIEGWQKLRELPNQA